MGHIKPLGKGCLQCSIAVLETDLPRASLACTHTIAHYMHQTTSSVQRPTSAALRVLPFTALQQAGSQACTAP